MRLGKGFYIHEAAKDVFIEIMKIQYADDKRVKAKVNIWNLGFTGNPWVILGNQNVVFDTSRLNEWRFFMPEVEWREFRRKQDEAQNKSDNL